VSSNDFLYKDGQPLDDTILLQAENKTGDPALPQAALECDSDFLTSVGLKLWTKLQSLQISRPIPQLYISYSFALFKGGGTPCPSLDHPQCTWLF
jgi:hypothetical protein